MGKTTGIAWTDHTFNPWWGCNKVSRGCDDCYADTQATFYGYNGNTKPVIWGPPHDTPRRLFGANHFTEPLMWNSTAKARGERELVFSGSMCDVFELHPDVTESRNLLFSLIEKTGYLDWLLLTKRPQMIRAMVPPHWLLGEWPRNAWIGTTAEDQATFDIRWPHLAEIREAPVRFISHEPALGPLDLLGHPSHPLGCEGVEGCEPKLNWVITGGLSGKNYKADAMEDRWALDVRDQCKGVAAFFFKQHSAFRSGQGPELDGRLYHEWPVVPGVPGALGGVRKAHLESLVTA
jgi:protein gp37